jgi:hypothetical protein
MSANEIKVLLGFDLNEIVEPMNLSEKLGIDICETALDQKKDGASIVCAIVNGDQPKIFYHKMLVDMNGSDRVVTTYALVHYVLCGSENLMITTRTIMTEQEEELIYELLMPKALVAEELKNGASINDLSKKFDVPKKCVRERLDALPIVLHDGTRSA